MTPQLAALFAQHRTAVLGGSAAAVAGLALYRRKKAATATATGTTAGATIAGTSPAAAVVGTNGTTGTGYDSSVTDLFSALQPELEALRQTSSTGSGITSAPTPVASSLFSPTYSGHYLSTDSSAAGGGPAMFEVESDGSLLALSKQQQAIASANKNSTIDQLSSQGTPSFLKGSTWYTAAANTQTASSGGAVGSKAYKAGGTNGWTGFNPLAKSTS